MNENAGPRLSKNSFGSNYSYCLIFLHSYTVFMACFLFSKLEAFSEFPFKGIVLVENGLLNILVSF